MILFQIKLNLPSTWRKWQTWRTWQNVGPTITCLETQFVTLHEGTSTSFSDTPISQWIFLGNPLVSLDPKNHQKPHWFIGSQPHPQLLRPPFQASKVPAQRLRVHLGAAVATERHQRHHHGGGEESSTDQATQPQTHLGWCRRHGISQLTCF